MLLKAGSKVKVRLEGEFHVANPALSMDEAEAKLRALGNEITARDDAARTFRHVVEREQVLEVDTEVP